jgi:rod shape-determining protein MreC
MARVETRRSRVLLALLVLAHLVAISNQVDGGGGASLLQRWTLSVLSPLQGALASLVHGVGSVWSSYVGLRGVHRENLRLAGRLNELELEVQQRREQAEEATRLRALLGVKQIMPVQSIVARVIARDGVPWYRTVTIDKGSADGVALNASVLSPLGVVGRVIRLGPHAARVQLLIDQQSGAGARIERSRITGVVSGMAPRGKDAEAAGAEVHRDKEPPCGDQVMKYVAMLADVVPQDVVVTSGLDRIYPPGLLIGRVCQVRTGPGLFKDIVVASSARFDSLEEVMVVMSPLPDDSTPLSLR